MLGLYNVFNELTKTLPIIQNYKKIAYVCYVICLTINFSHTVSSKHFINSRIVLKTKICLLMTTTMNILFILI